MSFASDFPADFLPDRRLVKLNMHVYATVLFIQKHNRTVEHYDHDLIKLSNAVYTVQSQFMKRRCGVDAVDAYSNNNPTSSNSIPAGRLRYFLYKASITFFVIIFAAIISDKFRA